MIFHSVDEGFIYYLLCIIHKTLLSPKYIFLSHFFFTNFRAWRSPKTMRSAAQLATHCWLDEDVRLGGIRNNGIISNLMDPLGAHIWPLEMNQIQNIDTASCATSVQTNIDSVKSIAVSRLSAAILHSRFINNVPVGNVPLNMRKIVLEKDIRSVRHTSII